MFISLIKIIQVNRRGDNSVSLSDSDAIHCPVTTEVLKSISMINVEIIYNINIDIDIYIINVISDLIYYIHVQMYVIQYMHVLYGRQC